MSERGEFPSKIPRKEDEAALNELGNDMRAILVAPGRKRRSSHASSSGVSSVGVRAIIQDEVKNMATANITGPLSKELKDQMWAARAQQQETVGAGETVVAEVQQAMGRQKATRDNSELQVSESNRRQRDRETSITKLAGYDYGSLGNSNVCKNNNVLRRKWRIRFISNKSKPRVSRGKSG